MKRRKYFFLLAIWVCLGLGCGRGNFSSGDRVLVSKSMYDTGLSQPERFDVVVFKYPVRPIEKGTPKNYIKRLLGLPGQLMAILFGRLFFMDPEGETPHFPEPQVLKLKDGRVLKGFVDPRKKAEEGKGIYFQYYLPEYKTDEGVRVVTEDRFKSIGPLPPDEIESLQPIDMSERWKHRISYTSLDAPRVMRSQQPTPDEADFGNDFDFLLEDHPWMYEWFRAGKFKISRKPPDVMLAMRRLVYDNDFQPKDLVGDHYQRWLPAKGSDWKAAEDRKKLGIAHAGADVDWLRYRHLVVPSPMGGGPRGGALAPRPQLIRDTYGYNKYSSAEGREGSKNWVGDLMVECTVEVMEPKGEFWLETSRGHERFRARWDLATGQCTLFREFDGKVEELATKETRMKAKGSYQVRFANFCSRLTVWVDRDLPFGNGVDYDPIDVPKAGEFKGLSDQAFAEEMAKRRGPTKNDLEPISIGVKGTTLEVSGLRVWRDTYYSRSVWLAGSLHEEDGPSDPTDADTDNLSFKQMSPKFYYIQPGHYMCLGDNSTMSADSRMWGLVPDRLMLGRAHMVYFPFDRAGPIK